MTGGLCCSAAHSGHSATQRAREQGNTLGTEKSAKAEENHEERRGCLETSAGQTGKQQRKRDKAGIHPDTSALQGATKKYSLLVGDCGVVKFYIVPWLIYFTDFEECMQVMNLSMSQSMQPLPKKRHQCMFLQRQPFVFCSIKVIAAHPLGTLGRVCQMCSLNRKKKCMKKVLRG